MNDRFGELNETQKRLLREVAKGRTSKEMSSDVGLEPGSIDVYISDALRRLGAGNRKSAAAALIEHEATILNRSEFRPEGIANPEKVPHSENQRRRPSFLRRLNFPPIGGREHDYSFQDRMLASFKIAGLGFLVVIVLSMMISTLFWAFPKPQ